MSENESGAGGPLRDLKVVEVASFVAVPAAGAMLADLGASVVKVEVPSGEIYRKGRPAFQGFDSDFPESPGFQMDNRGKRSMALDLTRPAARAALLRVIDAADVVLTNLLPERRRKYGLDHDSLRARKPSLVVGAISGYGMDGPRADEPAFDYTAYWARGGLMDLMRDAGVPPSMQRPGIGDHAAASNLVCGLLAALRERDRTGEGAYVDVSLRNTALHIMGTDAATTLVTGVAPGRHDRKAPLNALWNTYPVAGDDRWLMLCMIEPDRYWDSFCRAIGREDLLVDERFADGWARTRNAAALVAELETTFAGKTLAEWEKVLEESRVIWAPVKRIDEVVEEPSARAHGYFHTLRHAEAGEFDTVSAPIQIDGHDLKPAAAAAPLGADTRAVLAEAGLSEQEIDEIL
ncbi:MAG: CoA transferase [Myxococcales bacterium]|nr:CoA transferase [Myxococcales bacterium]